MDNRLPVNILTGFLGSGKTTLLNRLLRDPAFANCAVLINEFGEVGIDHHLVESVEGDVVLLQSGCICCTIRGDLSSAIKKLYDQRERGTIPAFTRLLIETTGLADPTPVLATVMHDTVLQHHFRPGNIIATVDAVHAAGQLERHAESRKQIALADRLVLTKTDCMSRPTAVHPESAIHPTAIHPEPVEGRAQDVDHIDLDAGQPPDPTESPSHPTAVHPEPVEGPARTQSLIAALTRLNPAAPIIIAGSNPIDADALLGQDIFRETGKIDEVGRWLRAAEHRKYFPVHSGDPNRHGDIQAFVLEPGDGIDWAAFSLWLSLLLHRHGEHVLRVKGLLHVEGAEMPVAIHGVQQMMHPPQHLAHWPEGSRRSSVVFIVQGIEPARVIASWHGFHERLGQKAVTA